MLHKACYLRVSVNLKIMLIVFDKPHEGMTLQYNLF